MFAYQAESGDQEQLARLWQKLKDCYDELGETSNILTNAAQTINSNDVQINSSHIRDDQGENLQ